MKHSASTQPLPFMLETPAREPERDLSCPAPPPTVAEASESVMVEYHKAFYELRNKTLDSIGDASKSFDKTLTTLSGGALALSITFVREIVPHPSPWSTWLLGLSWVLFGLALLLILGSFLSSQKAWERHLEIEEQAYRNGGVATDMDNPAARRTGILNLWSFLTFVAGVVSLISFASYNFCSPIVTPRRPNMAGPPSDSNRPDAIKGLIPPKFVLPRPEPQPGTGTIPPRSTIPPPPPPKPTSGEGK